jgi:tetratricopeptide (TPR) repeat protein
MDMHTAPADPVGTVLAALALHRDGRIAEAETAYRAALAADPCQPSALYLLGRLALDGGRVEEAAALLGRAADLRPGHADTLRALADAAVALLRAGRPAEALAAAERAVALAPGLAVAHFAAGLALRALGRDADAAPALERAVALDPADARVWLALGNLRADLDRLDEAECNLRRAMALDPSLPEAPASLGALLTATGRLAEAVAACTAALRLDPGLAPARFNRSFAHLLAGDWRAGWDDYEARAQHPHFAANFARLSGRQWHGEPLDGGTLLVHAGQGLGDTIQCARYFPRLAGSGARVVLACPPALFTLLRQVPGVDELVARGGAWPDATAWVDQLSLPGRFATRPDTVPSPAGYLRAEPRRVARWHLRDGDAEGPRVGLAWAGNPTHPNDRRRSLPLATLAPLLGAEMTIRGLRFVSLQIGPAAAEMAQHYGLPDLTHELADLADTAALIETLDLVIAVDTTVAHLAGALGRPVWVLLPHAPDWRWLLGRDDTPWYDSARLFRQTRPGDWDAVIARVGRALRDRFGAGYAPRNLSTSAGAIATIFSNSPSSVSVMREGVNS